MNCQITLDAQAKYALQTTGSFYDAVDALKAVGWSERPAARAVASAQRMQPLALRSNTKR